MDKNIEKTVQKVRITFITPILGTQPQKDVATEYLAKKFVDNGGVLPDDEIGTLDEALKKGTTVFHKLNGSPIFYDYQIKGFIKEAGRVFNGLRDVKNLRSKIDNYVFVNPRQINIQMPAGSEISFLERPLRAMTPQGERVGLAKSELIPDGSIIEFELHVYNGPVEMDLIKDLFTYGHDKGIGQWRNGGYGRFDFEFV